MGLTRRVGGAAFAAAILLTAFAWPGSVHASTEVFGNNAPITITDNTAGSSEASTINVPAGTFDGTITSVGVGLNTFSHNDAEEVDVLLVGPTGVKMMLLSDCGADANNEFPQFITTGTPANCAVDIGFGPYVPTDPDPGESLPAAAPPAPYALSLGDFSGTDPNGVWTLYLNDDTINGMGGLVSTGWSLSITDTDPTPTPVPTPTPNPNPTTTPAPVAVPTFNLRRAIKKCRKRLDDNAKRRAKCIRDARRKAAATSAQ